MPVEWTREQKLQALTIKKMLSDAGITEEAMAAELATWPAAQSVEDYVGTLYGAAQALGVDEGQYDAAWAFIEKELSGSASLPEGWLSEGAPDRALAQAADMSPELVDEAMSTAQRLGAIIPAREQMMRSSVDPVKDADLIEKATQARTWDQQKKAYDALYKAGSFAQGMAGTEMGPYGFRPAMTPHAISPEELLIEKGKLEERLVTLHRLKSEAESEHLRSERERERSRRELTLEFHRQYNKNLGELSTTARHRVDTKIAKKEDLESSFADLKKVLDLTGHSQRSTVETGVSNFSSTADPNDRSDEVAKTLNQLSGHPEAQFLLIRDLNKAAETHYSADYGRPPANWLDDVSSFEARAIALAPGLNENEKASIRTSYNTYRAKNAQAREIRTEADAVQEEIDRIVMPGVDRLHARRVRQTDPYVERTFDLSLAGDAPPMLQAPPLEKASDASSYVAGVIPGSTLSGSEVTLPNGQLVSYENFSKSYPQAQVDSSTGNIIPEMVPTKMLDRSITRLEGEIEKLDEPQLSDMDEIKEEIMSDPRFNEWMQREGYSSREKAYEFFKKEYSQRRKLQGPATDRQMRDANILSGGAPASLAERVGAVARTAVGPAGKQRRQRRRQALLQMLSPGPKSSRVTEDIAAEELPGEAPETAKVTPETAPVAQPTWKDTGDGTEYTLQDDGTITYTKADGTEISVSKEEKPDAYDAILGMRPEAPEGWSEETQAKGKAYVDAMAAEGIVPTGLPRQVTTSREELKKELAAVPGAETREGASPEETERIGLLERLRFGREERGLGEKGDTPGWFKDAQKKKAYEEARAAADSARARDEEPPAWAATILDMEPLEGLDRGEIQRATTEPSTTEEPWTKTTGTGSEGIPLSSVGHLREGTDVAKERTVPVLPTPRPKMTYGGALVGDNGVAPSAEEQEQFAREQEALDRGGHTYKGLPVMEPFSLPPRLSREEARKRALLKALTEPSPL